MTDTHTDRPGVSRRSLVLGASGAAVFAVGGGGAGYAIASTDGKPTGGAPAQSAALAGPPKYRSRPDLRALPEVTITTKANATAPGYLFLTPASGAGLWGPLIVDDQGSPVWFRKTP
ncbi:MAG: hypothetical protein QOE51_4972, partial [Actinoplanes sp.]|nr:hypothetical protein [Actinoplanes sp.]